MPCTSSDGFYAERFPDPESSLTPGVPINVLMTYMHKAEEKENKYLEIIDDVMIQQENLSDESPYESRAEQPHLHLLSLRANLSMAKNYFCFRSNKEY